MEQDYNLKKWSKGCPNTGINCRRSSCGIEYVFIPAALGDDQEGSPVAPKNGSYNNAIVYYEATGNVYLYSSDGVPTRVEKNLDSIIAELQRELDGLETGLADETAAREAADAAIEQEIEDLRNEPDVVDIVGTYADLQAYDTSDLGDKDIIRVLVDETHDNESTYYRWNKTPQTWTYIGAIEGYYTKDQTDALLDEKQDTLTAGANIQINNNVISATDTTYSNFTGTDGTTAGAAGLVPAPAATDAGKFLKADGTWDTVSSGPTVVQSPGTSTTDVMSQNATTAMVFADPNTRRRIQIGASTYTASGVSGTVSIGAGSSVQQDGCVAIGASSGGVAAFPAKGMVHIGTADTRYGYNSSNYRLLTGLYEPQSAHDAANKEYVDGRVLTNAGAPTTSTVGTVGQILEDTTNGKLYICTDATDPYVWEEVGSGGSSSGVSDVQIDGASIVSGGVATIPFAASSSAGVIKVGTAVSTYMGSDNRLSATTRTYEDYTSGSAAMFIGKGTLENVITGKGLVTNTTYPDNGDAGVIKVGASYGTSIASSGHLISSVRAYEAYSTAGAYMFISKGTLENVITGKGLPTLTLSTTDIGEGASLPANTLYGVYE